LSIGGWKVTPTNPRTAQEFVHFPRHDTIQPRIRCTSEIEVKDLKLTHLPGRISVIQSTCQTGNGTEERIQEIRKRQEQNVLVEWISTDFAVGQNSEKDNHDHKAKQKEQRAVDGPHDYQAFV
jgi:hypothetical protein